MLKPLSLSLPRIISATLFYSNPLLWTPLSSFRNVSSQPKEKRTNPFLGFLFHKHLSYNPNHQTFSLSLSLWFPQTPSFQSNRSPALISAPLVLPAFAPTSRNATVFFFFSFFFCQLKLALSYSLLEKKKKKKLFLGFSNSSELRPACLELGVSIQFCSLRTYLINFQIEVVFLKVLDWWEV